MSHTLVLVLMLNIALVFFLTGCCGKQQAAVSVAPKEQKDAQAQEYVVKHAMGETKINGTPKRIVTLTNEATEAVLAMGVKPVGATRAFYGNWYDHMKADMEGAQDVGTEHQPNLEAIAALKPDLLSETNCARRKCISSYPPSHKRYFP